MREKTDIETVVDIWKRYMDGADWQELIEGVESKATNCGPVYEIPNPIDGRPNEGFAIADMRGVPFAEPHYHTNSEVEIYYVLQGLGRVVVGDTVREVARGDVVVTPPDTAHYAIPDKDHGLVLGVVNTPPFNPQNCIDVTATNPSVHYNHQLFQQLTQDLAG